MSSPTLPSHQAKRPPPLVETSSFFSFFTFQFIQPLILFGRKNEISEEHLHELSKREDVGLLTERLSQEWDTEVQKEQPNFWKVLYKIFGPFYSTTVLTSGIEAAAQIGEAVLLG
ncbi:hypothetical protein K7432_008066 [Basidiobolus ranarum]|uniref:Uncharacterized protein n=1 Tax=Basidiobolus ranarum TaxID=34480 RepID=A0ABR2WSN2_9FUNG